MKNKFDNIGKLLSLVVEPASFCVLLIEENVSLQVIPIDEKPPTFISSFY